MKNATKTPPINLDHYFFSEINIKARKPEDAEQIQERVMAVDDIKRDVQVYGHEDKNDSFMVELKISTIDEQSQDCGYDLHLAMIGFFTVNKNADEKEKAGIAAVLGPTLLWGAAREFIATLTCRGPWPAILLPTVSFIPDNQNEETVRENDQSNNSLPSA